MRAFLRILGYLIRNLDHHRRTFWLGTLAAVGHGVIMFAIPAFIAVHLNQLVNGEHPPFLPLGLTLAGLFIALQGSQYYLRRRGELLAPLFANYLRRKYFRRILAKRILWTQHVHSVYLLSLINRLADHFDRVLRNWFWTLVPDAILVPLLLVVTFRESLVAGTLVSGTLIVFVVVGFQLSRRLQPMYKQLQERSASYLGRYADFMGNIRTVKKLHVETFSRDRTQHDEEDVNDVLTDIHRFHAKRWAILHGLYNVMYLAIMGYFLVGIGNGTAQIGIIVLLIPMLERIQRVIGRTIELITTIIEADAYLDGIEGMIDEGDTAEQFMTALPQWSTIRVTNLTFDYTSGQDEFRLSVPSLSIRRGERVGIIGRSGHGKSTFLDLLGGHHRPQQGTIAIDETPYADISTAFFRETFSFIAQDAELFNMSLRENILLGHEVDPDRLREILDGAHLAPLVKQLKHGLDTVVGERGVRLSLGERQRVNIARGVVLNREVYLFDEVTSNVDKETERRILVYLFERLRGKTLFVVSHRVENLSTMDRILVFDGGALVADDTFEHLKHDNAIFRALLAHPSRTATPDTAS